MKKITLIFLVLGLITFANAQQSETYFHLELDGKPVDLNSCITNKTDYRNLKLVITKEPEVSGISLELTLNDETTKQFEDYHEFNAFDLKFWLLQNLAFVKPGMLSFNFSKNAISIETFSICVKKEDESSMGMMETRGEAEPDYIKLPVYYATDRNYMKTGDVYETFGTRRSSLRYGMCVVSIPHDHRVGHIESPSVWKLEFSEDPEKHVVLHKIYIYNKDSFFDKLKQGIQESSKKSSFLFVHGYNTSFADAAKRTAQISYDLKFDGEAVFYSWPSKESVAEYTRDESNIEWAQHDLELFLTDYISKSGAEEIYLVAHSMGNRGLTRAITNVIKEHPDYKEKIKEIILAAPDIDADVFKRDIAPKMIQTIQKPITLYVSSDDLALKASKEVHGYARAGDSGDGLVVINGIETVDATGIDTSFLSHSYFADTSSIIADIFDLIKTGKRALYRKSLQLIELSNKVYYKVVKK